MERRIRKTVIGEKTKSWTHKEVYKSMKINLSLIWVEVLNVLLLIQPHSTHLMIEWNFPMAHRIESVDWFW